MIVLGQGETDPLSVLSVREHTLKSYLIQLSHPGKATWKGEPIRESRRARWKLLAPDDPWRRRRRQQHQQVAALAAPPGAARPAPRGALALTRHGRSGSPFLPH